MSGIAERIRLIAKKEGTVLCFGIDPDFRRMKTENIEGYYYPIVDALLENHLISAIKPNYAYFSQYGFEGLRALKRVIDEYKRKTYVILDAKRGDIERTNVAYAKEVYDFWGAHGTTLSPYIGPNSVKPFLRRDRMCYLLCRTSNEDAAYIQELKSGGCFVYEKIAKLAMTYKCGLVVGATSRAMEKVIKQTKNKVPMLIPGIGAQGGDLKMVMKAISPNPFIHRINVSSSIAYAHERRKKGIVRSAIGEAEELNKEVREWINQG